MKRLFDLIAACALIMISLPILIVVGGLVAIWLGRPILFRQRRPGLHGKPFLLLKFRSMTERRGPSGQLLSDKERLTRFGKMLRASSLDELPSLLNVLKGDMSLVGPRPLLMKYLPLYSPFQQKRHLARPGLTGWAQVNGRNAISWEERLALDVWYVENRSFILDIHILLLTLKKVIQRDGITTKTGDTMPEFKGEERKNSG